MHYILKIYIFLLCLSLYSSPLYAKTYINGIDRNYPPFAFINIKNQADGFDVKAMDWIAKEMGFEVRHQAVEWENIVDSLVNGSIDMVCSGMSITEERKLKIRFTEAYYELSNVFAVHKDSTLIMQEIYTRDIKLGIQRGTAEHILFEQGKIANDYKYRLYFYSSSPLALESLAYKRIDAVAVGIFPAQDAIKNKKDIKILGTYSDSDFFGVGLRKNAKDDELFELVNEGYKRLQNDPYWEELKSLYLD